jgi:pentatricopeptide repeat protein
MLPVQPSVVSYTIAIQACLRADDPDRADALIDRMTAGTSPTTRTFNELLAAYPGGRDSGGGKKPAHFPSHAGSLPTIRWHRYLVRQYGTGSVDEVGTLGCTGTRARYTTNSKPEIL